MTNQDLLFRLNKEFPEPDGIPNKPHIILARLQRLLPELRSLDPVSDRTILCRIRRIALDEFGGRTPLGAILNDYGSKRLLKAYERIVKENAKLFRDIAHNLEWEHYDQTWNPTQMTDEEIRSRLEQVPATETPTENEPDPMPSLFSAEEIKHCRQVICDHWKISQRNPESEWAKENNRKIAEEYRELNTPEAQELIARGRAKLATFSDGASSYERMAEKFYATHELVGPLGVETQPPSLDDNSPLDDLLQELSQ